MKLVKFTHNGRTTQGLTDGAMVRVAGPWQEGPAEQAAFTLPACSAAQLRQLFADARESHPLEQVRLAPPMDARGKVLCVGLNFRDHARELGQAMPEHLPVFIRSMDSLVGHEAALMHPGISATYDYEGEIAVIMGRAGWRLRPDEALDHVCGYTCFMDGSVREYQRHSVSAGKNFWRSGAMGPWIVTADEAGAIHAAAIETRVNGAVVQAGTSADMFVDIASIIAYCSQWARLAPGDVIATGTPGGTGARRQPPLWLKPGDTAEVSVAGIGVLRNTVTPAPPPHSPAPNAGAWQSPR